MSLRDKALSTPTRKRETVTTEWGDVVVLELDTDARIAFLSSIDPDAVRVDLGPLLPYFHTLVLDPETSKPVFGIEDIDTLKSEHPGIVTRLVMKSIDMSELDDGDAASAEGN